MACRRTAVWNIIGLVFKYGCRLLLESHRWSWWTHLDWFCVSAAVEFPIAAVHCVCSVRLCAAWWTFTVDCVRTWSYTRLYTNMKILIFIVSWYFLPFDFFVSQCSTYKGLPKRFQIVTLWTSPQIHKADLIWCTFTAGINQLRKTRHCPICSAPGWIMEVADSVSYTRSCSNFHHHQTLLVHPGQTQLSSQKGWSSAF